MLTAIINLVTIVVFVYYVHVLYKLGYRNALPEQKWVVGYFFLLILFQNPVYYTIVWYPASTDIVSASYCSYVFDQLSQAGLFTLWLFYADSVRRKVRSKLLFYLPKLFFGAFILSIGLSVLTFQFPNVDSTNESDRSPVESVVNWSDKEKLDFISLSVIYLLLLWIWAIYWFISLYQTSQHLKRLPYMNTRYLQLSYRFFLLQASLVTIYYVAQYGSVIYLLSLGAQTDSESTSSLTDDINTLFRQQTQLFGKMLFLTVYAFILAYLFLPVDLGDGNTRGLKAVLQSTYVISESEHKELVRLRRAALRGIKKNFVNQLVMINQLMTLVGSNRKSDVFCVDIAILLRNISFEAYHDPPSKKTASGYEGSMSLKEVDSHIKSANQSSGTDEFVMVDFHYNEDHEVFCFVCKNTVTGKLIVAFRGTASKKQMEDNLNYSQRFIDWLKLDTAADYNDGLDVPKDCKFLLIDCI